jgi:magnesium transporter
MPSEFFQQSCLIEYSEKEHFRKAFTPEIIRCLVSKSKKTHWLNTYGLSFFEDVRSVIKENELDDFLVKLMLEPEHRNKLVLLDGLFFLSVNVLLPHEAVVDTEQMYFVVSSSFLWSLQEKKGDYFEAIRERINKGKGLVRKKKADYLLFLIIDSIIDNYADTLKTISSSSPVSSDLSKLNPSPEFIQELEEKKQQFLTLKRSIMSLREVIGKIGQIELPNFETNYFAELKAQSSYVVEDADSELQQLESTLNLSFSLQSHRLNEIMKTLTILSVVFIPLTFLAGIYGMNFKNMPELEMEYAYFYLLAFMFLSAVLSILFFKRKKWF